MLLLTTLKIHWPTIIGTNAHNKILFIKTTHFLIFLGSFLVLAEWPAMCKLDW